MLRQIVGILVGFLSFFPVWLALAIFVRLNVKMAPSLNIPFLIHIAIASIISGYICSLIAGKKEWFFSLTVGLLLTIKVLTGRALIMGQSQNRSAFLITALIICSVIVGFSLVGGYLRGIQKRRFPITGGGA